MRKTNSDVTLSWHNLLKQVFSSNNLIIKEDKSLLFDLRLIVSLQVCYQIVAKWLPWNQVPGIRLPGSIAVI